MILTLPNLPLKLIFVLQLYFLLDCENHFFFFYLAEIKSLLGKTSWCLTSRMSWKGLLVSELLNLKLISALFNISLSHHFLIRSLHQSCYMAGIPRFIINKWFQLYLLILESKVAYIMLKYTRKIFLWQIALQFQNYYYNGLPLLVE